jgi:hypothetical protein
MDRRAFISSKNAVQFSLRTQMQLFADIRVKHGQMEGNKRGTVR